MRICVLGGCGDMGKIVVKTLISEEDVEEVKIADLDIEKAENFAKELGKKAKFCKVDANDEKSLVEVLKGYDVGVGCIGPFYKFEKKLVSGSIKAGVNYVSIADDYVAALDAISFNKDAKEKGITAITGLGNCPGITNVLAKKGASLLDRAEKINISFAGGSQDAEGKANIHHAIYMYYGKILSFLDGKQVYVDAGSGEEIVEFPPPIGKLAVFHTGHAEPVTIPKNIPDLKEVTLKGGIHPTWLSKLAILLGKLNLTNTPTKREKLTNLVYRLLPIMGKGGIDVSGLRVDIHGLKNGKKMHLWYACVEKMRIMTGVPAAIGALFIGRGIIKEKGVFAPEEVIEPDLFLKELEKRNIKIVTGKID
jgi:saccharopine dehydrogenase-like NADP-dependent oxidoreductase